MGSLSQTTPLFEQLQGDRDTAGSCRSSLGDWTRQTEKGELDLQVR